MRTSEASENYSANNNTSNNSNDAIHVASTYDVSTNASQYSNTANTPRLNMFGSSHNANFSANPNMRRRPRAEYDP